MSLLCSQFVFAGFSKAISESHAEVFDYSKIIMRMVSFVSRPDFAQL